MSKKDTEQPKKVGDLTREELEQLEGEPLPERVQMSLIGAIQGLPVNLPVPPVDES
jgi:hypothetical protein